jgi:hypothetical protein
MTLFIRNDTAGAGTGMVYPNQAEQDLFIISNSDPALGETAASSPGLIEVTYAKKTKTGFCPERLSELVNTQFTKVPADPIDIVIIAVDQSFKLNNGSLITRYQGITVKPYGHDPEGVEMNPTASILVIYNKNTAGNCQFGLVSKKYDLPVPTAVLLFHELSHAYRDAKQEELPTFSPAECTSSEEEEAAEKDENELRKQLNLPLRDPTNICGHPCTASNGCCIVASIATGSESEELNALRQLRERFLRRSEVGYDFFEYLHYDYYAFSPQVCGEMATDATLTGNVGTYYVRPLKSCLQLAAAHLIDGEPPEQIAQHLIEGVPEDLAELSAAEILSAVGVLRAEDRPPSRWREQLPVTPTLASESEFVRWALIEPIAIYLSALVEHSEGVGPQELGTRFTDQLARWGGELPITEIWSTFSDYELRRELGFLGECLLRAPTARRHFAERLVQELPSHERLAGLLLEAGYPLGD